MWLETEYHWHFSVGSKCLERESTWEEEQKKALWLWIAQALWDNSALAAAEESWIQVSVEAGKCFLWEHSQSLPKVLLSLETCLAMGFIKGAASSQQSHKLLSWTSRTDVWCLREHLWDDRCPKQVKMLWESHTARKEWLLLRGFPSSSPDFPDPYCLIFLAGQLSNGLYLTL